MPAAPDPAVVDWLLASPEPAIRRLVRRELLGQLAEGERPVIEGRVVRALFDGQQPDGGFGDTRTGSGSAHTGDWSLSSSSAFHPASPAVSPRPARPSTGSPVRATETGCR